MSVAKSYAKALYEAVYLKEDGSHSDSLEQELTTFLDLLNSSKELQVSLMSPLTSLQEKILILEEFSRKLNLSGGFSRFLILLVRKGRLNILKAIQENFKSVRLSSEGGVSGDLVSAEPIGESDLSTLVKAFSQKLGKKVAFQVSTFDYPIKH